MIIDSRPLKILMLEDNPDDVILIERILLKANVNFIKHTVDTRQDFLAAVNLFTPDVILSDHGLPGFNSKEALKLAVQLCSSTPFILVTGSVSDEYAISCLRQGADDYILKSNLARLPTAIFSALKKRKVEKLKREARHALRRQNEALIKVNKELDSFFYSVSHNLRGPVASMSGLIHLADQEKDVEKLQPIFDMMRKSVGRLDETLREILDLAKNARDKIEVDRINWKSILDNVCTDLKIPRVNTGEEDSIILNLRSDTPFFSDGSRVKAVLLNLLSNAVQYSSGTRTHIVEIELSSTNSEAIIIISDNGIGIREECLPLVFNMFFRGTERSFGAGLGLYIVKDIIQRLNGSVSIESVVDGGTIVTVVLPNNELSTLAGV